MFLKASTSVSSLFGCNILHCFPEKLDFFNATSPSYAQKALIMLRKGVTVAEMLLSAFYFLTATLSCSKLQIKSNVVLHPSFRSLFFLPSRSLFDFRVWAHRCVFSLCPACEVVFDYDLVFSVLMHREQSSHVHS